MAINKNREYRAMSIPLAAASKEKRFESECYVEGYATTFMPYLLYEWDGIKYYEKIDKDALNGADVSDVIMLYNHEGRVLARMRNGTLNIEADNKGLFVYADLSKSDEAKSIYNDITAGLIDRMSWAFSINEDSYDQETRTRTIFRIKKVYDVSPVSIPANEDTEISARSFAQGRFVAEQQEMLKRRARILKLKIESEV
jgi:HK97 family phage prohead protease